jgi:hypothetical protein
MPRIDLSEAEIRRYYEARLPKLHKCGKEWRAACPIHKGTRESLAIDLSTGTWFCHSGCARGGSIFDFEAEVSGVNGKEARAAVLALVGRSEPKRCIIVATYDYTDENGLLLYQTVRYEPKDFRQRRPDGQGDWVWNLKDVRKVLYRLPAVLAAPIVFVVEGEKDADALTELGVVATTSPMGACKWRSGYSQFLRGKQVYVLPDADEKGRQHAADVMKSLEGVATSAKLVELPGAKDAAEWIRKGGTLEALVSLAERKEAGPEPRAEAVGLAEVIEVFRKWLHLPDIAALLVTLGAVAANLLKGDALWLLLVGATGSGKTEFLDSLLGLPYNMHPVGTLTEASLLSGSPKREKAADATGGLLRCIGDFGFLLLKDFTSVLAMSGEIRLSVLAALREIHDGHWTRHVGVDGGRKLPWSGKCALVGGCTPAIDLHHQVMAMMGERFVLMRIPSVDGEKQADSAMAHIGLEKQMRAELRSAISALFSSIRIPVACDFDAGARKRMAALASFVAHARSGVERDRYHREIELIPDTEMPGRLAVTLRRLFHGLEVIGVSREECWKLVARVGLDCIPDVRRKVLTCLWQQAFFSQQGGKIEEIEDIGDIEDIETSAVAEAISYPKTTTRRVLEDLNGHRLVHRFTKDKVGEEGKVVGQRHTWRISGLSRELLHRAQVSL